MQQTSTEIGATMSRTQVELNISKLCGAHNYPVAVATVKQNPVKNHGYQIHILEYFSLEQLLFCARDE
jgi:hypothetical protein